jgi:peptidoglycan glycosyltransferase
MFLALISVVIYVQFISVSDLQSDGRNTRQTYNSLNVFRGNIMVQGKPIAYSQPTDDNYSYQRVYTNGPLYAPITGFFSVANPADRGLEAAQTLELSGEANSQWYSKLKKLITGNTQGGSIETTIDENLQQVAFDAIGEQQGSAIAMDPKTGKILAMVSKPSYDPSSLAVHSMKKAGEAYSSLTASDDSPLINSAIGYRSPPGSTFKLITSAAALESGRYQLDSVIDAPQTYLLPGTETYLPNFEGETCSWSGKQTLADSLRMSCNTAFAKLGVDLGVDAVAEQAKKFGVGTRWTIAGDPNNGYPMKSARSEFPDPDKTSPDRLALASIGQGDVTFTLLQDALVTQAIFNNGEEMNPYIVDYVTDYSGTKVSITKPKKSGQPISPTTAQSLQKMMEEVTGSGTATGFRMDGVRTGGKTGTADTEIGKEANAWFTGYASDGTKDLVVAVFIKGGNTGASTAVPVATKMMQTMFGAGK